MILTTTIVSIVVFSLIILFLVILLGVAEKQLLPQGDAKILINGDNEKSPSVKPGGSLLSSLSSQNIFIPSACGGGGTCAGSRTRARRRRSRRPSKRSSGRGSSSRARSLNGRTTNRAA